jgi:hypothetical protein
MYNNACFVNLYSNLRIALDILTNLHIPFYCRQLPNFLFPIPHPFLIIRLAVGAPMATCIHNGIHNFIHPLAGNLCALEVFLLLTPLQYKEYTYISQVPAFECFIYHFIIHFTGIPAVW